MISKILPSASNSKSCSRLLEQFYLTVGQNNFGNKIPFTEHKFAWISAMVLWLSQFNFKTWQTPYLSALDCWHSLVFLFSIFQNSIRHNLSLHSRFKRVQNEGQGKSSWWMMNHEATRAVATTANLGSNPAKHCR